MAIEKVFILHHTHVDLGYTDIRPRVERALVDMVDEALDLCKRSARRPEPERFRWIHEVSWPVLRWLERSPRRKRELLRSIRSGMTELTALYLNPTDLFDRDTLEASTDFAVELARCESLPLDTAMFSDCPGIAWSIPDILSARGIRHLSAAPDVIMSAPLEVERPFYWEGPCGGRVLTWFSDWRNWWYAEGLDFIKMCGDPAAASDNLAAYLSKLEGEGYRWTGLAIHAAYDNRGPRRELMDFVAHWNRHNPGVEARMATNHDFFAYMEKRHAGQFAVHRGAWPDWWANGHGSAACEVACSRRAEASLRRSAALARQLRCRSAGDYLKSRREAMESVLLFDEHTWGDAKSVAAPWSPRSRAEWEMKRAYAYRGLVESVKLEQRLLARIRPKDEVVVFNPHAESVTAPVALFSTGGGPNASLLLDKRTGARIVGQRSTPENSAGVPADWYLVSVPPHSRRSFSRVESQAPATHEERLESRYYKVGHSSRGRVLSIFDNELERQLLGSDSEWSFGELIHERVPGALGRRAFYDRSFGTASQESKRTPKRLIRIGGDSASHGARVVAGPVFTSLVSEGALPFVKFEKEIRLYHGLRRLDVLLRLHKQARVDYESLYVAFPFAVAPCDVWIENAGAVYRAGKDQLPGSATDWLSIGEYLAISGARGTVIIVPHGSPLIQIGAINTGKWLPRLSVRNGHIYSWIMNNMWPTNFPGYQEGTVELAWSLTSHVGKFSEKKSQQFAAAARVGLSVRDAAGEPGIPRSW